MLGSSCVAGQLAASQEVSFDKLWINKQINRSNVHVRIFVPYTPLSPKRPLCVHIVYEFLISAIHAICPANIILLAFIMLTIHNLVSPSQRNVMPKCAVHQAKYLCNIPIAANKYCHQTSSYFVLSLYKKSVSCYWFILLLIAANFRNFTFLGVFFGITNVALHLHPSSWSLRPLRFCSSFFSCKVRLQFSVWTTLCCFKAVTVTKAACVFLWNNRWMSAHVICNLNI
jgi:hypothetical protein